MDTIENNNNNHYVTTEMFNAGIESLKSEILKSNELLRSEFNSKIDKNTTELKNEIRVSNVQIEGIKARLDDVHFYFSIYFAVITIMIALIALIPVISQFFKSFRKPSVSVEVVQDMIDKAISKAFSTRGSN